MSFTAIILTHVYFCACLSVSHSFLMADLKEQCSYIKFSLKLMKFALVTREMIKRDFDGNAVG